MKKKKHVATKDSENIKIKLPFLLANIPDRPKNRLDAHYTHNDKKLELISNLPMQCYGDADVLGKLGFGEIYK